MHLNLPTQISQLDVYSTNLPVGLLTHESHYCYQPYEVNRPVSLTMYRQTLEPYNHGTLHPIFSQNLPEGTNRRYISERLARYAKVNDMYFLALQGDNGIGMLSYQCGHEFPHAEQISIKDILEYKGKKPLFPQLLEKYYLRNMIAGIQPKVLLTTDVTKRTIEQKEIIVKAADEQFPLLTINEYVCMESARYCKLDVPNTFLSNNFETFIIERFDNINGVAFGYEDFTTLMKKGQEPDAKYKSSYESLLKATHLFTRDLKEVEKMYQYIVFNCLIGNGDAHLKNFAVQYAPDMIKVFVSPIYDVTHTQIYANKYQVIDDKMALKLAKSKTFPDKARLMALGIIASLSKERSAEIVESLAQGIMEYLAISNEVKEFEGLRESIENSVRTGVGSTYNPKGFIYDRRVKFPT